MKYARYVRGSGEIEGLYDTAVHTSIPSRTVEITDEEWSNIVSNPGKYMIDISGETATVVEKTRFTLSEITAHRASGQSCVDSAAECCRRQYLTLTAGQDTIYLWKYEEAMAFKNRGGDAAYLDDYPLVKADYEAFTEAELNMTPLEVAEYIIDKHTEARVKAATLERIRRSAKERIAKTNTRQDIEAIVENAKEQMKEV